MRILMIEDESEVFDYVAMFLREAGFRVDSAQSATQLREVLPGTAYDLILLDLILPDGTGPELLPWMKSQAPKTPVLVVTGLAADDERLLFCLKNGAAGYVTKSARADELLAGIRNALGR